MFERITPRRRRRTVHPAALQIATGVIGIVLGCLALALILEVQS